jgi:glycine C-acetyltransferase/8-amino-7-oxononanoate synthase
MIDIEQRLQEIRQRGLYRRMRMISGPQGPRVLLDGKPVLLLCSNNYLGLADHPRVRQAAADAAMRWGVGAGASRLVSGNMTVHRRLEERLADFEGSEACVLFGSGYLANLGIIPALAGEGDVVFSDRLNHASIVDGCRLARAETFVYEHCDTEHLAWGLRQAQDRAALIVTDSVFSMDGDVAPLAEIVDLARDHGVRVMIDEAHATGVLGPGGRGAIAEAGLEGEVDVVVGTLGKALGSYGAYVCCDSALAHYMVNRARSLIFSTAPPPPAIAGALAALELLQEQPRRVDRLRANADCLRAELAREGFQVSGSATQIIPLVVGEPESAMRLCEAAIEEGVFAQAIRPPTVPDGTARLRLAVMASHSRTELRQAAAALSRAALRVGFDAASALPLAVLHDALPDVDADMPDDDFASTEEAEQETMVAVQEAGADRPVPFDLEKADAVASAA